MHTLRTEVLVVGAGITGLWLRRSLASAGIGSITIERAGLGGTQTLSAQGIIHGGLKYGLDGRLSAIGQALSQAPARWRDALAGRGPVDLSQARVRSDSVLMWMSDPQLGWLLGPIAQHALCSPTHVVSAEQAPPLLVDAARQGRLRRIEELVVDVPSVVRTLAEGEHSPLLRLDPLEARWTMEAGALRALEWNRPALRIEPEAVVFCAGAGNAELLTRLSQDTPQMQRRPLHMVIVHQQDLPALQLHIVTHSPRPVLTLTSHLTQNGALCWYLGGELAEQGVSRSPAEQQQAAREQLSSLFPALDLHAATLTSLLIDRAEPRQPGFARPEGPRVFACANVLVTWPTKLALAPLLVEEIMATLKTRALARTYKNGVEDLPQKLWPPGLDIPGFGHAPWDFPPTAA